METQKASIKKIAFNYGLILALLTIGVSVIVYVLGLQYDQPWWQSLLNFGIMTLMIVYGLKAFQKENDGYLSLGEALKTGVAISLIAGIVGSIFTYLFVTVIEPEFIVNMLDITRDKMVEQNPDITEEQLEMGIGITEKMMTPGIMIAMGIIASLFFGFIISLIAGLIMKRKSPLLP